MRSPLLGTSLIILVTGALCAPALAQHRDLYRVDERSTARNTLTLCSSAVDVTVTGDEDTDLDFTIRDASGRVVHRDTNITDSTAVRLTPNVAPGRCTNYTLEVENLGDVYNEYIVGLDEVGPDDDEDRWVTIHNHTPEDFMVVRFSNTGDPGWGPDRIPGAILRAGGDTTLNIDDGSGACEFDIRAEARSGRVYAQDDINVCRVATVEFGTVSH